MRLIEADLDARILERFLPKIDKTSSPNGCWLWTAAKHGGGYGLFRVYGQARMAHRVSYLLFRGQIPEKYDVCHDCPSGDNPVCVNPAHLWAGTKQEHALDTRAKGQLATGDRNGSRLHPERLARGDRNGARTHPERLARGDRNGSHKHPEKLVKGDAHWTRRYPERRTTGDRNGSRTHPERVPRGDRHWKTKLHKAVQKECV